MTPDLKYVHFDCNTLREQLKIHIHKSRHTNLLQGEFVLVLSSLFITVQPPHHCFLTFPCVPLLLCTVHHPFFNTFSLHLVPTERQLTFSAITYLTQLLTICFFCATFINWAKSAVCTFKTVCLWIWKTKSLHREEEQQESGSVQNVMYRRKKFGVTEPQWEKLINIR